MEWVAHIRYWLFFFFFFFFFFPSFCCFLAGSWLCKPLRNLAQRYQMQQHPFEQYFWCCYWSTSVRDSAHKIILFYLCSNAFLSFSMRVLISDFGTSADILGAPPAKRTGNTGTVVSSICKYNIYKFIVHSYMVLIPCKLFNNRST
jgi:hypothetical protein